MLRYSAAVFVLMAALLAACIITTQKISAESHNRAVEICMDYNEVKAIAAVTDNSVEEVLKRMKKSGVTTVAIEMDTIASAAAKGHVIQRTPGEYELSGYSNLTFIPRLFDLVFGDRISIVLYGSTILLRFDNTVINKDLIERLPIGFYDRELEDAKSANMLICGRIPAYDGADEASIACILDYLQLLEIDRIIFNGDTILGYRSCLEYLGREMDRRNIYFGRIEFARQKGETTLAEENLKHLIGVHSISQAEMASMAQDTAIERYVKAARERNVRLLYVRPFDKTGADPLKECCLYTRSLAERLARAGCAVKPVHPTLQLQENRLLKAIAAAGAAMAILVLVCLIFNISPTLQLVCAVPAIGLFSFMGWQGGMCIKIVTLLLGITVPVLATACAVKNISDGSLKKGNLLTAGAAVLIAFGVTLGGAILNLALLSDTSYVMRNQVYAGVKLVHFAPLLIVSLLCVTGALYRKMSLRDMTEALKSCMSKPANIGLIIIGACLLAVVALMLARSGNDAGIGVSAAELKLRSILDRIVYVRPRSKEFLIGYPSLLLGFFLLFRNNRAWGGFFAVIGTIALISLFNTFCHIHTPVIISLIRAANGLWCGLLAGAVVYIAARKPLRK
ncbi:MAG: hypothetical protein IK083_08205 [Abditibacteriota bacterium]|nr:hypothetical protein [Abditibacteriota bacterium]